MKEETEEDETWGKKGYLAGDYVIRVGRDYHFEGHVVCVFWKTKGQKRYVVENADGLLLIFREAQLVKADMVTEGYGRKK